MRFNPIYQTDDGKRGLDLGSPFFLIIMVLLLLVGAPLWLVFVPFIFLAIFLLMFSLVAVNHYLSGSRITLNHGGKPVGYLQRGVGFVRENEK